MKKVAILLDGGFVLKRLYILLGRRHATARQVLEFAQACTVDDEEIFRIYYYDCAPFDEIRQNPLPPHRRIDFSQTEVARRNVRLQKDLATSDLVAFRQGVLTYEGWGLTRAAEERLLRPGAPPRAVQPSDLKAKFRQKAVDMKIGLDVAWLASKKIVHRIILATGDFDFVPAMKFARREGTQVVLVPMGCWLIKKELREHADYVRNVVYPPPTPATPSP